MNIAKYLHEQAEAFPWKRAIVVTQETSAKAGTGWQRESYSHLTFQELKTGSDLLAQKFLNLGIKRGSKVLLFLKPSLDFPLVTFALFKIGAIPVFMDPGMGRKNLLESISQVRPEALIAVPLVHWFKRLFPRVFSSVKVFISTGDWGRGEEGSSFAGLGQRYSLPKLLQSDAGTAKAKAIEILEEMDLHETAAILFTSGGTGIPKGVLYTHAIFSAQIRILQETFALGPEDVDLPGFPLFSLFTISMGMTSCVPPMDPTRPAKCNPQKLVKTILDHGVSFAAGSPAIWERVADYCLQEKLQLPSLRQVVMFGAPVPMDLHEKWKKILPQGTTFTPYGATECLPISNISGEEILTTSIKSETLTGRGTCVGKPVAGMQIRIIKISDTVLEKFADLDFLAAEEIGEVLVFGEVTTAAYADMPEETRLSKIWEGERVWHRMGDLGFLDKEGRLWFCGRKVHRVQTGEAMLYTEPCELIFNLHPMIKRTALIGLGKAGTQVPAVVVEEGTAFQGKHRKLFRKKIEEDLLQLASQYPHTQLVRKVFFIENFPVDIRHNIKIDRLKLKVWAEEGRQGSPRT